MNVLWVGSRVLGTIAVLLALLATPLSALPAAAMSSPGLNLSPFALAPLQIPDSEYQALVALYEATDGGNWRFPWDRRPPSATYKGSNRDPRTPS